MIGLQLGHRRAEVVRLDLAGSADYPGSIRERTDRHEGDVSQRGFLDGQFQGRM